MGESEALDEILEEDGFRARVKLSSWLYRMSSWGLAPLRYLFVQGASHGNGFWALPSGEQDLEFGSGTVRDLGPFVPGKLRRLREFAVAGREAGIQVVFVTVPRFGESPPGEAEAFDWIRELAHDESAWFFEFHEDARFRAADQYRDRMHLHGEAARELSRLIVERIAEESGGRWGPG